MDASDESQILSFSKIVINTQMLLLTGTGIKERKKERKLEENGTLGTRLLHSPLLLKWGRHSQMTLIGSVKDRTRGGVGVGDS